MIRCEKPPHEWFADAARCYVEKHQGCPWCGGSYRVFHTQRGSHCEYYCSGCDFHAGHDAASDSYFSFPGAEDGGDKPGTMYDI